jgi:hypothetical protein
MMLRLLRATSFLVVALLGTDIADLDARELQLPACLFKVVFPGEPTVQEQTAPTVDGFIRWYTASEKTSAALLRHECLCARGMYKDNLSEAYVRDRLSKFVEASGLSNPTFTTIPFRPGLAVKLRAYKKIQGTPATYEGTAFLTSDCYADVVVGARSRDFPPAETSAFVRSVTLLKSALPGPYAAQWIEFQRTPTGAIRHFDVRNVSAIGPVITYFQKFVTSRGGRIAVSKSQIQCSTGHARTEESQFFDADGVFVSAVQYSPADDPFRPVPNDPAVTVLTPVLCDAGRAVDPRDVSARLSRLGHR